MLLQSLMTSFLTCNPVPVPDADRARIVSAAYDARASIRSDLKFEKVTVTKCILDHTWSEEDGDFPRTSEVTLYGVFPQTEKTNRYRARYSITCHDVTTSFRSDVLEKIDECYEEFERYLWHERLGREIRLYGPVSVDTADAYVNYLLDYDFGTAPDGRGDSSMREIASVRSWALDGQIRLSAFIPRSKCSGKVFQAVALRPLDPDFEGVSGSSLICD